MAADVVPGTPPARRRLTTRTALRVVGALLLAAGLAVGADIGWELYGTNLVQERTQHRLLGQLHRQWSEESGASAGSAAARRVRPTAPGAAAVPTGLPAGAAVSDPTAGRGLALLRIPRLGPSWQQVVVQGVSTADLQEGPGHYPGTAMPGRTGNMVLSGHRTTYGAPFRHLDRLRPGDPLVVEVRDAVYTYWVLQERVVAPGDTGVLLPVPERPGARPTEALLTLTTCNPVFSASQRLVVLARLAATTPTPTPGR